MSGLVLGSQIVVSKGAHAGLFGTVVDVDGRAKSRVSLLGSNGPISFTASYWPRSIFLGSRVFCDFLLIELQ
jgi:hypothetical protein